MATKNMSDIKGRIIYFSHGGGPLPILGDQSHKAMVDFMTQLSSEIARPEAIIVISAHWEERVPTVLGSPNPTMFYDYYGFPDAAYDIRYPAPGHPALAKRIVGLLKARNIESRIDDQRGFDHGLFIPLKLMYPEAGIPAIQISLVRGLHPDLHVKLGNALRELMQDNILVIGSGFSFHNMGAFSWEGNKAPDPENSAFQDWLISVCTDPVSQAEREQQLIHWEAAPAARYCHPREEHLLPLHVCLGMAEETVPALKIFDDYILGKRAVAFQW